MQVFDSPIRSLKTAMGGLLLLSFAIGFLCVSFVHLIPPHAGMDSMIGMHHSNQSATLSSCCGAGTTDHMELWKSTLTGIPQGFQDALILITLVFVATFTSLSFFATPRLNTNFLFSRYKQYAREHPDIGLFNPLRLAFAKGILNPKLF